MSLATVAATALAQMDGTDWRQAFLNGELGNKNNMAEPSRHAPGTGSSPQSMDTRDGGEMATSQSAISSGGANGDGSPEQVNGGSDMTTTGGTTISTDTTEHSEMSDARDQSTSRAARLANARAVKASNSKKRVLNYWTDAEEQALWAALAEHGPRWATIVKLHGEGGEVNEALKARDQAALYSKAIYTKKMLVECGKDVPNYLQRLSVRGKRIRNNQATAESNLGQALPVKRRSRRALQPTEVQRAIKEEDLIVIDASDDENDSKVWHALPSSTPKADPGRQAGKRSKEMGAGMDPQLLKLQLEAAKRAIDTADRRKEAAELEVLLYQSEHPSKHPH